MRCFSQRFQKRTPDTFPTRYPVILVDWQIPARVNRGFISMEAFDPPSVQPNSPGILPGNPFAWYKDGDQEYP